MIVDQMGVNMLFYMMLHVDMFLKIHKPHNILIIVIIFSTATTRRCYIKFAFLRVNVKRSAVVKFVNTCAICSFFKYMDICYY
jgi:hypothetical protein